ncbi:SDR family NAD(P)-dependent oxidoreductase [Prescottella equi]|uniref:SDR family NAD(P)-dependent oxidoreductase n=1 Tax=Rhodococcus hoagii TaxID=43767 RepID=A0A9Q5F462_RHOHA|nr:SDR family NAD(P)-dependent oxidoreductase [Prescottella equi]MBM4479600.1 SDR family NAD(P)-dependent oxidoreductase [Prescottella equi]MBM4486876.1 SDR family NAD(P)-dependent oxidoreductase [Prescottella equi]MBM4500226.1 SDR family NAD(P)-dependent oxidoreductase [Prescottella equi]MBM4502828.1 SDR family NAD(P)-dependent oxidoreductase [Prescottella equi]MBM4505412.1 SDR family NAD(P)-dependent oxidoreductase [Prescottella equi]
MNELRFDGQVALVTGVSTFGLGLTYARTLAARGCAVVVNDLGRDWAGGSNAPGTDEAVRLIESDGGTATGVTGDVVTEADRIVQAAVDTFGRLDIVVNNAGAGGDFDTLVDVHLRGAHRVTEAAWPHLSASGNGRILNISSNGSYGAPAMPGYAAAKGAILSLTRTQAILGKRIGVRSNAILPAAWTRSTAGIEQPGFGEFLQAHFPPEAVAAFAAYLLHADTTLTGEVFAVGGGLVSRVVQAETPGALTDEHTPEAWSALIDEVMTPGTMTVSKSLWSQLDSFVSRMDPRTRADWEAVKVAPDVDGKVTA